MIIYPFGGNNFEEYTQDVNEFLDFLSERFPQYMHQADRLQQILLCFRHQECMTAIIEPEYVDKQYRDSYYVYFAQKYREIARNCLRLTFFDGLVGMDDFRNRDDKLANCFAGIVVLRPLYVGAIGKTLIDPKKVYLSGMLQTCHFQSTISGVIFNYRAFPFSSQDNETMTCAQTSLYNLISYYGRKYPEYRTLMPNEILHQIESNHYERVLPANGLQDEYIAKVLLDTHFYPRLYKGIKNFREILHIYVESGIPFILGLPAHAVNCIGRAHIDKDMSKHKLEDVVNKKQVEEETLYLLSTSTLTDEYIVMDDNREPYRMTSLDNITREYFNEYSDRISMSGVHMGQQGDGIEEIIQTHDSMIVPLYRRVYIDAPKAKDVFSAVFLENLDFVKSIRDAYDDPNWGNCIENPLVWRIYLTTSKKYRDFKVKNAPNLEVAKYYMNHIFPHFIWVMELGTLCTLKNQKARVEILLDASSSVNSESRSILSVTYKNHLLFLPSLTTEDIRKELEDSVGFLSGEHEDSKKIHLPVSQRYLTAAFLMLYNFEHDLFPEEYDVFNNLEEVD